MAAQVPHYPEVTASLTLAVIALSSEPTLLLDRNFIVLAASLSFYRQFGIVAADALGFQIFDLAHGDWNLPQLRVLLDDTITGQTEIDVSEMDLRVEGPEPRRLVLKAQMLIYGDMANVRLLLTVSDVTDARADERLRADRIRETDDLIQEKAILLQEVQHRVANSLQIIAAVLLHNARRVQSEESRRHLHDAHQRVMSVALLQRRLAASSVGSVALRPYLTELCGSLGASMIRDHNQISLAASADESTVNADVSICLGLIVTELVINALKHAFPGDRLGQIRVGYRSEGSQWTLSVSDDGIGILSSPVAARPGLGTSIMEALASQLRATIWVSDTKPGTAVSIIHDASLMAL